MTKKLDLRSSDLVGFSRLANGGVAGVTDVVQALHGQIAFASSPTPAHKLTAAITSLVYNNIRAVSGMIDGSLVAVQPLLPDASDRRVSRRREAVVAAVNGVLGDYLVRTNNPLAISMSLRCHGRPVEIERNALKTRLRPTGRILLLVHGLCLSDLQWKRKAHDHGAALAHELGYTSMYLHYNSGLHVSDNGQLLADLLETLLDQWPVPVEELVIVGHSMGGLVARSAHHHATEAGHLWPRHLRKLIFLGTPHHGSPLEQLGNWVDTALEVSPYTTPFARLGKVRSEGITDMRYGNLLEDHWEGRDRFAPGIDVRSPIPLPQNVQSYAVAASRQPVGTSASDSLGDGLVMVNSALGRHPKPEMTLEFDDSHQWIGYGMNHWDLLSHAAVYEQIRRWLSSEN